MRKTYVSLTGVTLHGQKKRGYKFPRVFPKSPFSRSWLPPGPSWRLCAVPPGPQRGSEHHRNVLRGSSGGFCERFGGIISPVGLTPLLSKSQKPTVMHPRLYRREPGGPLDVETCTAERRRWPPGPPQAAEPAFEPFRLRAGTAPVLGICHRCNVPALPVPVGGPCGWKPPQRQNPPALAKHSSLVAGRPGELWVFH